MCGRFNVIDSPEVRQLMDLVGVSLNSKERRMRFSDDISPASKISIIHQTHEDVVLSDAIWWLMLDPHTGKPTNYTSFNTRSDKLSQPRSLGYRPYRETRCIIVASAFIEGLGDGRTYHKIEIVGEAIAFGGLYREHLNVETGEVYVGASIITLGGHIAWENIHPSSMPLMLPIDKTEILRAWLDPANKEIEQFDSLLVPQVHKTQRVTEIGRPSKWDAKSAPFLIAPC